MRRPRSISARPGFTLIELLVSSLVTAMVAGAATVATSQLLRLKTRSAERAQAVARADTAAARVALDLVSTVRHSDLRFARVRITPGTGTTGRSDELLILSRSRRPVRGGYGVPEGGEFSVQYRLGPAPGSSNAALWRRSNMAVFAIPDSGGIAAPSVTGVSELALEATDGADWFPSWDSDSEGLPHAVRVTAVGVSDNGRTSATARRVVALERVPVPVDATTEVTESDPAAAPATTTPAGGGGGR